MTFRVLNSRLGCSPFATHAYREPPSSTFYEAYAFRVGRRAEGFLPQNPPSVALPRRPSQVKLDYGQLRQEPAITELDWPFTPIPRSEERLSTAPLQASTGYYSRFTLPRYSSPGFGSDPSDSPHFHTVLLASCKHSVSLRVLSKILPLPLKSTPRPVIQNVRCNPEGQQHSIPNEFQVFSPPVTVTFQLSLTVLVRYRS